MEAVALSRCCASFVGPTSAVKWVCIPADDQCTGAEKGPEQPKQHPQEEEKEGRKNNNEAEVAVAVSGASLLSLLEIDHPVARGFRDAILGHDASVGVGATCAAVLSGAWAASLAGILYSEGKRHKAGAQGRDGAEASVHLPAVLQLLHETIEECAMLAERNALSPLIVANLLMALPDSIHKEDGGGSSSSVAASVCIDEGGGSGSSGKGGVASVVVSVSGINSSVSGGGGSVAGGGGNDGGYIDDAVADDAAAAAEADADAEAEATSWFFTDGESTAETPPFASVPTPAPAPAPVPAHAASTAPTAPAPVVLRQQNQYDRLARAVCYDKNTARLVSTVLSAMHCPPACDADAVDARIGVGSGGGIGMVETDAGCYEGNIQMTHIVGPGKYKPTTPLVFS